MDDFDSLLLPSNNQNVELDSLDWSFLLDTGAHPHARDLEGAGLECELKRFDSVYNSKGDRMVLESGSKNHIKVDNRRGLSSALVLTKYWANDMSMKHKELEIRSPHMKAALKNAVPEYKDFQVHLKHIVIKDEPQCLFHFRDELQSYGANLQDYSAARHVQFLLKYMWWELSAQISTYTYNMSVERGTESLDHDCLWMAFKQGDLVYIPAGGYKDEQVLRFISMERWYTSWSASLLMISSDGKLFREKITEHQIKHYEGFRQLSSLPFVPLKYHPDAAHIEARLLDRGKKFCRLHGPKHRQYNGVAALLADNRNLTILGEDDSFPTRSTMVNGRVLIDTKAFYEARPAQEQIFSASRKSFDPELDERLYMKDEDYVICDNLVEGYSLQDKSWGYFQVRLLDEVDFNTSAFDSLILDNRLKEQILSLVQVHSHENLKFDDVIRGKGRGMIFLLHGEPGVGKTLTAESVADYTRKPLLRLDAASLGTTASSVETELLSLFRFSERWKAVALLDEADVFLNEREATNVVHNSLVSVFLRLMEYYEGILFLTTNRIETFDRAFKSRIHLAIHYPKLSRESRRSLWCLFLSRSSVDSAASLETDGTIDRIANEELNGRQIKNVVRSAYSLAFSKNSLIQSHHINTALEPLNLFENDFESAVRQKEAQRALNYQGGELEHTAKRRRI